MTADLSVAPGTVSAVTEDAPAGSTPPTLAPRRVLLGDPRTWEAAVADVDGPQLVLAGPGTGKTEFLARRVAHLIRGGRSPDSVLALTFSRRAAAELEQRIGAGLERPAANASASTFHSLAFRMVEVDRHRRGMAVPVLLTGPEQVRLVGRMLGEENPAAWPAGFRPLLGSSTFAGEVTDFILRCQERLIDPDTLEALAAGRADWRPLPGFLRRYRRRLESEGKIDYGTLVNLALDLARSDFGDRFSHVVVDEYQDTSPAQALLAESLAGGGANLTAAADPHQSIYSFRGADPGNLERLLATMAGRGLPTTIWVLGRSLRVPAEILASGRRLVEPNPPLSSLDLVIEPAAHPGRVEAYTFDQRSAEAEWIAGEVERLHSRDGVSLASMAVLVRSSRHLLPELSRALDRRRIPHDRPDNRLVDHPAVRLLVDVVEAATARAGSPEADLALRRLLLGPLLAVSLSRERQLTRQARAPGRSWDEVLRTELPELLPLAELLADPEWATTWPAVDGFWHLWDRLPGIDRLATDPGRGEFRSAWATLARLLERQAERDPTVSLRDYLEAAEGGDFEASPQLRHARHDEERLVVTTLHQAKGLEFEVVFVADAVEGVFPDSRRTRSLLQAHMLGVVADSDGRPQVASRLEEERRLAYTAVTRARRRVIWTATTAGIEESERRPSRFMLAAAGVGSFDQIGPPPGGEEGGFEPLSLLDAQARLRRMLMDPAAPASTRLAALASLAAGSHWDPAGFAGVPEPGPDTGLVDGALTLSPSQAAAYRECPRRYALERRLRAADVESPYARFGSIVHEVLENTERQAMGAGLPHGDLARALAELDQVWERYPPFGPAPIDAAWRRRGRRLLEEMYSNWPGGQAPPVALEVELNTEVEGTRWTGRADRVELVDGGLKVVDYKTSKNPPPVKEVAASLQLGYYLLAAAEHPGLSAHGDPVAAELWFPLAQRKNRAFAFDMSNLPEVRRALAEVAAGIAAEDWRAQVGGHCERCPFRQVCPAWPDGREGFR